MKYLEFFNAELNNPQTRYFILDSKGDASIGDIDFEKYSWYRSRFNKLNESDLVIFRRPGKASETGKFYLYGAAKIGQILGEDRVTAKLIKPFPFAEYLHMSDLEEFEWQFKKRGNTWEYFFNQYGMNQITEIDFRGLMDCGQSEFDDFDPVAAVEAHQNIQKNNYSADDKLTTIKGRAKHSQFSNNVKANYRCLCAICGIQTRSFIVASHIVPWAKRSDTRLDPSNGISLCVMHDKAFDKGFITLSDELKVIITKRIKDPVILRFLKEIENKEILKPTSSPPSILYLKYHRDEIFDKFI